MDGSGPGAPRPDRRDAALTMAEQLAEACPRVELERLAAMHEVKHFRLQRLDGGVAYLQDSPLNHASPDFLVRALLTLARIGAETCETAASAPMGQAARIVRATLRPRQEQRR